MKRILTLALAAAIAAGAAGAESVLSTADLTAAAAAGNLDLRKARSSLEEARKALAGESDLMGSRVSASGRYDYSASQTGGVSGQLSLTVPVIPQVSVGASVDVQGKGSLSVNVSPFAAAAARYNEKAAYRKAAL